jgi:hypothetical protein
MRDKMTKQINITYGDEQRIILYVDSNPVKDITVPEGKSLKVLAREVTVYTSGTNLSVTVDGVEQFNYTVPTGFAVVLETELFDNE